MFDVFLLIGIVQGLVAIVMLLMSNQQRLSNVFLVFAILSFCMLFLKVLTIFSSVFNTPFFRYFPIAFEMLTAPSFYIYFLALTEKEFHLQKYHAVHFLPFLIAQTYACYVYFSVFGLVDSSQIETILVTLHYGVVKELENWLIVISIAGYLLVGAKKYLIFQQRVRDNTADSAFPTLRWTKSIILLCGLLLIFLVFNMLVDRIWMLVQETRLHWEIYFIYIAAMTYYLGLMAFKQKPPDLKQIYNSTPYSDEVGIVDDDTRELAERIDALLEQTQLYLDPQLNVSQIASELDVNSAVVSLTINRYFGMSFRALINKYRIADVKTKLLDENNNASVISLALESGFNSEASFYRVFKASTGTTPKSFVANYNQSR